MGCCHAISLTDYELVNLREALRAMGYANWAHDRSPLDVLHSGDWTGQIFNKLQEHVAENDPNPNSTAEEYRKLAREWK